MSEYIKIETVRLQRKKAELLTKLGESIYYQYRIGNLYSEELKEIGEQIASLDQQLYQYYIKENSERTNLGHRCVCGHLAERHNTYCSECGRKLEFPEEEEQEKCDECGNEVNSQVQFCHACGTRQGVSR
ncbi:zinc ribbon domain-containing protein [Tenuibacillus multivorans]|uniref:Double zinc ribbon n=1 Tax=Tenuibacillus multivorans TaxID=237069 RepID=A0A1H0EK27_9BACI|nr:zinc ribbon domain-containing protein [Tenuibacillus multivorans]GEL77126.1 hypothetical protein TMU01_13610 [Tenuibacillus multivorans]SDN82700.1 Double zinc ribbon [Tenuibacillus multivorans]